MFINPQGPSSSPIEVTLNLSWPFNRHTLRKLCVELEKLAQLERELEMAGIHWNLCPDPPEEQEIKRLEKELEALALKIQSTYSTPSSP